MLLSMLRSLLMIALMSSDVCWSEGERARPVLPADMQDADIDALGWPKEREISITARRSLLNEQIQGQWLLKIRPSGISDAMQNEYYDEIVIDGDTLRGIKKVADGTYEEHLIMRYAIFFDMKGGDYIVRGAPKSSKGQIQCDDFTLIASLKVPASWPRDGQLMHFEVRQRSLGKEGPLVEYSRANPETADKH
jgi:hypothetical protein